MVQQYMNDSASVDPTLAGAVIQVAARHGDAELYSQFKAHMQKETSPQQYYRYFYALAQFPLPELTKQTLASLLTSDVRGQDLYILFPLLGNPASQDTTWEFMRSHFDQLQAKTGGGLGGVGIFLGSAQAFCDARKSAEVKQFFEQHPFPGTERNQREVIERIDGCVDLRDQQQAKLSAWLKQQNGTTNASGGDGASSGTVTVR